jgi:hypothetical protein
MLSAAGVLSNSGQTSVDTVMTNEDELIEISPGRTMDEIVDEDRGEC